MPFSPALCSDPERNSSICLITEAFLIAVVLNYSCMPPNGSSVESGAVSWCRTLINVSPCFDAFHEHVKCCQP
jgi:hypothetical protein